MELGDFLRQAILVLASSVAIVFLSSRLRIPSVAGLILSGILIGPSSLGWVEEVEVFAEIGVVLLLFVIGLELSVGQLRELRHSFLLGGGAQTLLTFGAAALLVRASGVPPRTAVFGAMLVVLSSTAVVLKIYGERRETHTPQGRVALGILLFQDFLIVPLIVLTPVLAGTAGVSTTDLAVRLGGALGAVVAIFLTGRYAIPWLLDHLLRVRVREILVLSTLLTCLALAWFTWSVGFSLALGAFLAGILVSESEYSRQVIADVAPFRDVFASLFFISIGMLVDLDFALRQLPLLLALAAGVIVLKALAAGIAVRMVGYPLRIAVIAGLGLAQIGEFSFVLMEVGRSTGLLNTVGFQTMLMVAVVTLLATPLLIHAAPGLGERAASLARRPEVSPEPAGGELEAHVVIAGYGVNGRLLARVLGQAHIPYVVVEISPTRVRQAREAGIPVLYGDATQREILSHAGVERTRCVVFAISDLRAMLRAVPLTRELNPSAAIIVRTRMTKEIETLRAAGADEVVAEEFESAIEIFTLVLERFHVPRNVIRTETRLLRGEGYRMLRHRFPGQQVSDTLLQALEAGTTDLFQVEAGSPAAGRTLRELELRGRSGASVIAIVRGERSHLNPPADMKIEEGDCLVLVGSHQEIDLAFQLLEAAAEAG